MPSRAEPDWERGPWPETPGAWLRLAEQWYRRHKLALGQITTNAHDEALYLILHTLDRPLDSGVEVLTRRLNAAQRRKLAAVFRRRVAGREPASYITREAWLGDLRFYVDERAIIPRSYFLEIIPGLGAEEEFGDPALKLGVNRGQVRRVADVCTGSGCLAILLARHFPKARVDAIDLSVGALEVARINVQAHRLSRRVRLFRSDVFDAVPAAKYDVILSNPPYEPSAVCAALPEEFQREPRMALDGGADGLDIIRKLLRQARSRLQPQGVVLIEVGGLRPAMEREFATWRPRWLTTQDGSDCVCVLRPPAGGATAARSR